MALEAGTMHDHSTSDSEIWMLCLIPTMPTSITGQDSSIPQHLRAAKKVMQDAVLNLEYVWDDEICHAA